MFGVAKSQVVVALEALSDVLCGYTRPEHIRGAGEPHVRCDCKYGFKGVREGEVNGCPETMQAARILSALTPIEFERACKRAGVSVSSHDVPPPQKKAKPRGARP